jgi:hypothetical protein
MVLLLLCLTLFLPAMAKASFVPSHQQMQQMVQQLLAGRFAVRV